MSKRKYKRAKKSNNLIPLVLGVVAAIVALVLVFVIFNSDGSNENNSSDATSSIESQISSEKDSSTSSKTDSSVSNVASKVESSKPSVSSNTNANTANLDPDFEMLLLVNGENPLPENYDSDVRKDLVEIDQKYRNNNYVTQIHKDVYPYITAMVAAAQAEGVDLMVWSPFRSYAIQKDLFQKQVDRVGGDEDKAATVVARPGTSEHNTGLCADFNMASDAFENTKMYTWMKKNAENYGFVMRYSKEKQPITGVIHESWHWRFVGINHAKKMNELGYCLEEYVDYLNGGAKN